MQSYRIFVVMCMTRIIFPSCTLCDYWRVYQRCYDAIRGVTMLVGTLRVELYIPYTYTRTIHCWYTDTKPFASVCKYLMYALTQTYTVSINSNWSTGFIPWGSKTMIPFQEIRNELPRDGMCAPTYVWRSILNKVTTHFSVSRNDWCLGIWIPDEGFALTRYLNMVWFAFL